MISIGIIAIKTVHSNSFLILYFVQKKVFFFNTGKSIRDVHDNLDYYESPMV